MLKKYDLSEIGEFIGLMLDFGLESVLVWGHDKIQYATFYKHYWKEG